jgi:hypothetical protein
VIAQVVYFLCALTSLIVAIMLFKAYQRQPSRLLFWSAISFCGFYLNNILLFIDLAVFPVEVSLAYYRSLTCLGSVAVLIYGLIWDTV